MQPPISIASGVTTAPFLVNPDGWVIIEAGNTSVTVQYTVATTTDVASGAAVYNTVGTFTGFTAIRADEELAEVWVKLTTSGGSATYHVEGQLSRDDRLTLRGYKRTSMNGLNPTYQLDPQGNVTGLVGPDGNQTTIIEPSKSSIAAKLPKLRAKLANIRAGLTTGTNGINGQLRLGIIGDSTTVGAGAGSGGVTNLNGARSKNVVVALAQALNSMGVPTIHDTFMGDQYVFGADASLTGYPNYDPRVTLTGTAGIYPDTNYSALGGIYFQLKAGTDSLTFTPGNAWDTAVIYYDNGAAGVANLTLGNAGAITGGTTLTTVATGNLALAQQTITITKAATSLVFTRSSGAPVIRGVWCYDSTTPRVNLFGLGEYGLKLTTEFNRYGTALATDLYDAVIINMSINDANSVGPSGLTAYINALTTLVTFCRVYNIDVMVATTSAVTTASSTVALYCNAITNFAVANNVPIIDLNTRMGGYTVANSTGLMNDGLHPNASGYQDIASAYANMIARP